MRNGLIVILMLCFLVPNLAQPEKSVSATDKKKFMALLKTLKIKGEFFTHDSIPKAIPYQNVLFAFEEKDIKDYALYPFLAVSNGMMEYNQCREYAIRNFVHIQHPVLKIAWGSMLLDTKNATPEIVRFLYQVLETPKQKKWLQAMSGPYFDETETKIKEEYGKLKSL